MRVSIIAALDEARGIGNDGDLPWRISADLKRFKALTMGHPIIMGRKTYESIGKPLPGRTNIVITRNPQFQVPGCTVVGSLDEALARAGAIDQEEVFVIGGGEIYRQAIDKADRCYLTEVAGKHPADTFFPEFEGFAETEREEHDEDGIAYAFVTKEKTRPS